jgi:hypothetical protein
MGNDDAVAAPADIEKRFENRDGLGVGAPGAITDLAIDDEFRSSPRRS